MKVIDMHCDTIHVLLNDKKQELYENRLNIDIKKLQQGEYLLQNFAMFTNLKKDGDPVQHVQRMIDLYYTELDKNKEYIAPIYCYEDIQKNLDNNKISSMLALEEGGVVNNDLAYLRNYYRLGVRMITLTWNYANGIGYPNFDIKNKMKRGYGVNNMKDGLTPFGIEFVRECERLGIIIDVSHLSDAGFYDVLKYTTKPFVASHSNARSVCDHARNMSDDMILKLAERKGVMGLNFCNSFLKKGEKTSYIQDMVKHVLYIKELAGIDVIGLGSDFDGIDPTVEFEHAGNMQQLKEALLAAGLTQEEVEKVFYKNVLRVYKEVLK